MTDTVQDLLNYSYEQKPVEFQNAFNSLMLDRIATAVDNKKIEVAQQMFADQPVDQEQEEEQNAETA